LSKLTRILNNFRLDEAGVIPAHFLLALSHWWKTMMEKCASESMGSMGPAKKMKEGEKPEKK
jgi:hypothetical protein